MSHTINTSIEIPDSYIPSESEEYMNQLQLAYFRQRLINWKGDLQKEFTETMDLLKEKNWNRPDMTDRASEEIDASIELRTKDRYRKLISKINDAIDRIDSGNYGYCEETNEPIGLKRLQARPIATLSIAAQERHEKFEKNHNEDE